MSESAQGSGGRRSGRLLIGLAIAAIAVIGYLSRTQVNPVTGEKQHVALDVDQEKALGLESAPQMAAQMGGEASPSDPDAQRVSEVGRRVVEKSSASRSPYADSFRFHLLNDPETVNAFALPGGPIFITEGLLRRLRTEAQLAGVLGHEAGHVVHRHVAEQMAKGQLGGLLAAAAGIAADDGSDRGQRAQAVAAMVNQVVQLRYSRQDESEADRYGVDAMAEAGYDPHAMLEVMRILADASQGPRPPEFLSSHPLPETRLRELEQYVREKGSAGAEGQPLSEGRPLD
jgi:predicted Zn-dependent protease